MKNPGKENDKMLKGKDRDWALFDLMEGNLSVEKTESLLEKFADDPTFEEDYNAWQMTKLPEDHVEYTKKSSLLKRESAPIAFFASWRQPMAIAASIAAIALIAFPLYRMLNEASPVEAVSSIAHSNDVDPAEDVASHNSKTAVASTVSETSDTEPNTTHVNSKKHFHLVNMDKEKIEDIQTEDTSAVMSIYSLLADVSPRNEVFQFINATDLPVIGMSSAQGLTVSNQMKPVEFSAYNGLRGSLNKGLAVAAAPFRNTRIEVKRNHNKKDPGVKIEVTTEQYYAVASVHLLARNNR